MGSKALVYQSFSKFSVLITKSDISHGSLRARCFKPWTQCCRSFLTNNSGSLISRYFAISGKSSNVADSNVFGFHQMRSLTCHQIDRPDPATTRKNLRYKVHYPEDGRYTIQPLKVTKLGGRDPETGRIIFGKIGGGHKQRFRWVINDRVPPGSPDPLIERVLHVQYDPMRSSLIALVGQDDQLRYIIASSTMKKGDLITSTRELPRNQIRPKEGNAHPVGALPIGTEICCVESQPHEGARFMIHGGTFGTVLRHLADKIVVQFDQHMHAKLDPNCLVTVGRVSNNNHSKLIKGSAQRARWLGIRPSSGLKQKKDGRYGWRPKKLKVLEFEPQPPPTPVLRLTVRSEGPRRKIVPSTNRVS